MIAAAPFFGENTAVGLCRTGFACPALPRGANCLALAGQAFPP